MITPHLQLLFYDISIEWVLNLFNKGNIDLCSAIFYQMPEETKSAALHKPKSIVSVPVTVSTKFVNASKTTLRFLVGQDIPHCCIVWYQSYHLLFILHRLLRSFTELMPG